MNKAFEVWYPTLEEGLNALKDQSSNSDGEKEAEDGISSSAMLEEILELSRDNQKLLRSPDSKLYDDMERVKETLEQLAVKNSIMYERRIISRKYHPMVLEEIMHMSGGRSSYGFLMTLSLFKEDFPWIYDMGKELVDILKSDSNSEEKENAVRAFREILDFTLGHPMMREVYSRNKNTMMLVKELPYALFRYLDNMSEKYCG